MVWLARQSWLLCICALVSVSAAHAENWEIVREDDRTRVVFISRATLESFEGKTHEVEGWISVGAGDSISWSISVDLVSLDTGIGLRNRHMRENHLHTDEFPTAVFDGAMEWPDGTPVLERGGVAELELTGQFELHGIASERVIPVSLSLSPENTLEAHASFEVSLADHEISRPKFLMLKLADVQEVRIRLLARPLRGNP